MEARRGAKEGKGGEGGGRGREGLAPLLVGRVEAEVEVGAIWERHVVKPGKRRVCAVALEPLSRGHELGQLVVRHFLTELGGGGVNHLPRGEGADKGLRI